MKSNGKKQLHRWGAQVPMQLVLHNLTQQIVCATSLFKLSKSLCRNLNPKLTGFLFRHLVLAPKENFLLSKIVTTFEKLPMAVEELFESLNDDSTTSVLQRCLIKSSLVSILGSSTIDLRTDTLYWRGRCQRVSYPHDTRPSQDTRGYSTWIWISCIWTFSRL